MFDVVLPPQEAGLDAVVISPETIFIASKQLVRTSDTRGLSCSSSVGLNLSVCVSSILLIELQYEAVARNVNLKGKDD